MGLARRSFFGVAAGGAVAGPSVVKQAAAQQFNDPHWIGYDKFDCVPADNPGWMRDHITQLRKDAAGDFPDPECLPLDSMYGNIDALRSVSPTAKVGMRAKQYARHEREQRMKRAAEELAQFIGLNGNMLKKLGLI